MSQTYDVDDIFYSIDGGITSRYILANVGFISFLL